jgi:hypothetical protein
MTVIRRGRRMVAWSLGILTCLLMAVLVLCELLIARGVENLSCKAMAQFQGDRVEALIALADCQQCRIEDRNHAVWALGQLRDPRALPVLYKYRTGKPCGHRTSICQHEIEKAIRWTEGKSYMAPQIWRILLTKERQKNSKRDSSLSSPAKAFNTITLLHQSAELSS